MKRIFQLTTTIMMGLCLSIVSCKDDEKNAAADPDSSEVGGGTVMNMSDSDALLAMLLRNWCEFVPEESVSGLSNKTFEPTVGEVFDPSSPNVRSIVVGTREAADAYAVQSLSVLGINPQSPAGFAWADEALGSVRYSHSSGNELGVITISIKQLPHLEKLRLVAESDGNTPQAGMPYYQKGDVVQYTGTGPLNGKLFICVNNHNAGQEGNWVNFDYESTSKLSVGTCNWMLTGTDYVYNEPQASFSTLHSWLTEFVLNDIGYDDIVFNLSNLQLVKDKINQVLPYPDSYRKRFLETYIRDPRDVVLDAWAPYGYKGNPNDTAQAVIAGWPKKVDKSTNSYEVYTYTPTKLWLCGTMRWSMGMTYHYWQPNLSLLKYGSNHDNLLNNRINESPSQNTLSPSHFQWSAYGDINVNTRVLSSELHGKYTLHQTAVHWTHDPYKLPDNNKKFYGLIDFTTNRASYLSAWDGRVVTSHELNIKDNGEEYKYFKDVYCHQRKPLPPEEDANNKDHPFYGYGDVLRDDEDGSLWWCLRSSAEQLTMKKDALFVSFDNITTYDDNDRSANNIVTEDEVVEVGVLFGSLISSLISGTGEQLQGLKNSFILGMGFDMETMVVKRDSIVVRQHNNRIVNYFFNIAYNDGTRNRQPIMRFVYDATDVMTVDRGQYSSAYNFFRMYKHYQTFAPGNTWQGDWTMSDQQMYLDDVTNQELVNKYANDKWAKLGGMGFLAAKGVRTTADGPSGAKVSSYLWPQNGLANANATGMYHEPVLFMRLMWLRDEHRHNKTSPDGHQLTLLAHQGDLIQKSTSISWTQHFDDGPVAEYNFLDNKKVKVTTKR